MNHDPELTRGFRIGTVEFHLSQNNQPESTVVLFEGGECPILVTDHHFTIDEGIAFVFAYQIGFDRKRSTSHIGWYDGRIEALDRTLPEESRHWPKT